MRPGVPNRPERRVEGDKDCRIGRKRPITAIVNTLRCRNSTLAIAEMGTITRTWTKPTMWTKKERMATRQAATKESVNWTRTAFASLPARVRIDKLSLRVRFYSVSGLFRDLRVWKSGLDFDLERERVHFGHSGVSIHSISGKVDPVAGGKGKYIFNIFSGFAHGFE